MKRIVPVFVLLPFLFAFGCDSTDAPQPAKERVSATPVDEPIPEPSTPTVDLAPVQKSVLPEDQSVAAQAIRRVGSAIDSTAELGPTTVVWLLDATETNAPTLQRATQEMERWYSNRGAKESTGDLKMAVALYGDRVNWLTESPVESAAELASALAKIRVDAAVEETTFAATEQAVARYLDERRNGGRALIVVIITDEAGNDATRVDAIAAQAGRFAIPFYIIGSPAPFGETTVISRPLEANVDGTPAVVHGPETRHSMHVNIPLTGSHWGADKIDSGYGPFALEYLARASGGQFLALRPEADDGVVRGLREIWPDSDSIRFPQEVMSRYRPDYVSAVESERIIEGNAVCRALVEAANIDEVETLEFPKLEFGKRNEAQLNRDLTDAQKGAAKMTPPLERLVETLQAGSTETAAPSKRWQASFDLAYARALAAKTRVEGYNMALAELKRSSTFKQPGSSRWVLEPSMEAADNSSLQRGAAKSKELLEGLIRDHADTPWAYFAKKELAVPVGWRWTEQ
ncbi:MAG: hypothetical protein NXI22_01050 [bacterium]|nr:hypothetical protein [bacterium]